VATQITIDQLLLEVTTAVAGSIRLGIYSADTDWQPVALILDAGTVDCSTTGVKSISINQTLSPGRYLLVLVSDVGPTVRVVRGGNRYAGLNTAIGTSAMIMSLYRAFTFAPLPDPPSDWDTIYTSSYPFNHAVLVRVATP